MIDDETITNIKSEKLLCLKKILNQISMPHRCVKGIARN